MSYKSPLSLYVVWHPANPLGLRYAEELYNSFCRDTYSPLTRGLNIPVNFRYLADSTGSTPIAIDTTLSARNAIILLCDEEMFADSSWHSYIQDLLHKEDETTRIFPVALSGYAFSIDEHRLSKKQFVNLTKTIGQNEEETFQERLTQLRSRLLHDLCRFFFKLEKVSSVEKQTDEPPVKLFVSHAKADGETLAMNFRDYVQSQTKLKTFFDVNDIADAEDFEEAITRNLKNSAIVVFLSDQYSTREWCRIEVIVAKRNKSPLVVVHNLKKGEKRSFPYMGNVPTIIHKDNSFDDIIDLALYQVLNNLFFEEKLKAEIQLYKLEDKYHTYALENAPELFNYIDIKKLQDKKKDSKDILVIYPDPPLGTEELRVLNDIDQNIQFITPSLIHKVIRNGK